MLAACSSDRVIIPNTGSDTPSQANTADTGATEQPDSGSSDSGSSDSGSSDSGSSDSGSSDSGSSDSGTNSTPVATVGDLVISELMIDAAAVADAHGEWVELYNDSGHVLSLSDLSLGDLDVDAWALDLDIEVEPGAYVVLCADTDSASNGGVVCDAALNYNTWGDGFALANAGDEVILARLDGPGSTVIAEVIDSMSYTEGQVTLGATLGLDPTRLDAGENDRASAWCTQTSLLPGGDAGTPGRVNDGC